MLRRMLTTLAVTGAVLALPAAAFAQTPHTYSADLTQANESGASGDVTIEVDGTTATVTVEGQNFFDGFPHAMHFHGEPGGDNVCGPLNPDDAGFDEADADGDGFISVAEGAPSYGGVMVSLTTEGDTSADSALAVDRFPTAGTLGYSRTVELPQEVADNLSTMHVVVHGGDLNDSGEVGDLGTPSSLDPSLDLEATVPVACGQITAMAAGGVATGAGGTATDTGTNGAAAALAGAAGIGVLGVSALRRRRSDIA